MKHHTLARTQGSHTHTGTGSVAVTVSLQCTLPIMCSHPLAVCVYGKLGLRSQVWLIAERAKERD